MVQQISDSFWSPSEMLIRLPGAITACFTKKKGNRDTAAQNFRDGPIWTPWQCFNHHNNKQLVLLQDDQNGSHTLEHVCIWKKPHIDQFQIHPCWHGESMKPQSIFWRLVSAHQLIPYRIDSGRVLPIPFPSFPSFPSFLRLARSPVTRWVKKGQNQRSHDQSTPLKWLWFAHGACLVWQWGSHHHLLRLRFPCPERCLHSHVIDIYIYIYRKRDNVYVYIYIYTHII